MEYTLFGGPVCMTDL